jgi:hypothetical protein
MSTALLVLSFAVVHAGGIKVESGSASSRPLSDFLDAQGSTNFFVPPLPDYIGWTNNNPQTLFASVDYAGVAAKYLLGHGGPDLGTTVGGTVTERELPDGRADVQVTLHLKNALTWVIAMPVTDVATDPLLYGTRGTDLLANPALKPTVSNCEFKVGFTNTALGAPLPDLMVFILGTNDPAQQLTAVLINASGEGTMHAAAGVPEGTRGRFNLINNGVFHASFKGGTADGFPAEVINLRPAGHAVVSAEVQASGGAPVSPASRRSSWARIKALYR